MSSFLRGTLIVVGAVILIIAFAVVGILVIRSGSGAQALPSVSNNGYAIVCDGVTSSQTICDDVAMNSRDIAVESERNNAQDISIAVDGVRIEDLERRVTDLETQVGDHETRLSRLEGIVSLLEDVYGDLGCGCAANAQLMTQFEIIAKMAVGTPYEGRMVKLMVALDECGRMVVTGTSLVPSPTTTTSTVPGTTTTTSTVPGITTTTTTVPATTTTTTSAKLKPIAQASPGADQALQGGSATICAYDAGSYDPDGGSIVSWSWTSAQGLGSKSGSSACWTTTSSGIFQFSLVVTDDEGATSNADSVTIIVIEEPSN